MVEGHAWNERLDLSHEGMDHEHHLQIALLGAFVDAVEQSRPALARRLAEQLLGYSSVHFGTEELLMEAIGYPERERHAGQHADLVAHIRQIQRALEEGDAEVSLEAALDLRHVLFQHMDEADRRVAEAVRARP